MLERQAVAVHLQPKDSGHVSRIAQLQVAENGQLKGYIDIDGVISDILNRYVRYYTQVGNSKAYVEVVNANPKYIRTVGDGTTADNLLKLPRY